MSSTVKTEAIVFKKKLLLGKDTIVTLFTEVEGKLSAIGKGLKKLTSKRSPHIQTGNLVSVVLYEKNNRLYLQESNLISAFSGIKMSSDKINYMYLMFFILDRVLPERQKEEEVYQFTKKFLIHLAKSPKFSKLEMTSEIHNLLILLGYHKEPKSYLELLQYIEEIIHEKVPPSII